MPIIRRSVALLAAAALTISGVALAAPPDSDGIDVEPSAADATAVRKGQMIDVSGTINAPSSTIDAAELIAYDANGDEITRQAVGFGLNTPESASGGEEYLHLDAEGNLDGQLELGCAFGDATSMPRDQVWPACKADEDGVAVDQTETAWDLQLAVHVGAQTFHSDVQRVDAIFPIIEGYEVVDPNTVIATFSEPVAHPNGFESSMDWNFRDGEATVIDVAVGTDDCEYAPGEDTRGGQDGCTRILTVVPALDRDATPRIDYFPGEGRDRHVDGALNPVYVRSIEPSRGAKADSLAADRVGPVAPSIEQVAGQPAEDPGTGERVVLGNDDEPTVVVGDLTDGHPVTVYSGDAVVGTGVAEGDSATITLDPLADGQHTLTATAEDEALCDPEDPDAGMCSNESEPSEAVTYDLDTVAPVLDGTPVTRSSRILLQFTEAIDGADDPAQWSLPNAQITDVDDERGDGLFGPGELTSRRTLTYTGTVETGDLLTYTPPASDAYADENGNEVAQFSTELTAAELPVISVRTEPGAETDQSLLAPDDAVTFTVELGEDLDPGQTVTVDWTTTNHGDAESDVDFAAASGRITIEGDQDTGDDASAPIEIEVLDDTLDEFDESVVIEMSNPQGAQFPDGSTTLAFSEVIVDDDPPAVAAFAPTEYSVEEGESVTVDVTLDTASGKQVRVDWRTDHDNSTADTNDAPVQSGELVFQPGDTQASFEVTTLPDNQAGPDKTLDVLLESPVNATLDGDADVATITILDGDVVVPTLSVDSPSVDEGSTGALGPFTPTSVIALESEDGSTPIEEHLDFTVTLDEPTEADVTVAWTTTSTGTAAAGSDHWAASGTLAIPAGETEGTVSIDVIDDDLDEFDESVDVRFSDLRNATFAGGGSTLVASSTIIDDDPLVTVDLGEDREVTEGEPATFDVTLSAPSGKDIEVRYRTTDGSARAGQDYRAVDDILTIPAGDESATFSVATLDDSVAESTEELQVTLSVVRDDTAVLGRDSATLTILDDDEAAIEGTVVLLTGDAVQEGDPVTPLDLPVGRNQLEFAIQLSDAADGPVTIDYTTRAGTATADEDFEPATGQVTIDDGDDSATVAVDVVGDFIDEFDEDLQLVLTRVRGNATIPGGQLARTGIIIDDDPQAQLRVNDATVLEGDVAELDVTLDNESGKDITVAWSLVDGTATVGQDYVADSGTLDFPAGTTSRTVQVATLADDDTDEFIEQFELVLSDPTNAGIDDGRGTISIIDIGVDGLPTATAVFLEDTTVQEGDSDHVIQVPVRLSSERDADTTVTWTTQELTATEGEDYRAEGGQVVIPAGATSAQIPITIIGDDEVEPDEDFLVLLTEAEGAVITGPIGRVTIEDDDSADDGSGDPGGGDGGDDVDGAPDGSSGGGDGGPASDQGGGSLPATGGGAGFAVFGLALLAARRRRE